MRTLDIYTGVRNYKIDRVWGMRHIYRVWETTKYIGYENIRCIYRGWEIAKYIGCEEWDIHIGCGNYKYLRYENIRYMYRVWEIAKYIGCEKLDIYTGCEKLQVCTWCDKLNICICIYIYIYVYLIRKDTHEKGARNCKIHRVWEIRHRDRVQKITCIYRVWKVEYVYIHIYVYTYYPQVHSRERC